MAVRSISAKSRNPQNLAGSVPNVPTDTQHSAEIWSEATSPPLTKGDLGGVSILVSQKRSRKNRLLFCDPVGGGGVACLSQTLKVLYALVNLRLQNTHCGCSNYNQMGSFIIHFYKSPTKAAFFNMPQNDVEGRFENFYPRFIEIFRKVSILYKRNQKM